MVLIHLVLKRGLLLSYMSEVKGWEMFQKVDSGKFLEVGTVIVQGLLMGATMSSYNLKKPDSYTLIISFHKG